MPRYVPVSRERHAGKSWTRFTNYAFTASQSAVPVLAAELPLAALNMPLAFVRQAETVTLIALLGLEPGVNAFVDPTGRWIGPHVPLNFKIYPFRFLTPPGASEPLLCIDEDSGLLTEGDEGEAFFDSHAEPSSAIRAAADHAFQLEQNQRATNLAVAALAEAGLLVPLPLKTLAGEVRRDGGLLRVDEAALGALADDKALQLRAAGALPVAYAQLISQPNVRKLEALTKLRRDQTSSLEGVRTMESLDELFGTEAGPDLRLH